MDTSEQGENVNFNNQQLDMSLSTSYAMLEKEMQAEMFSEGNTSQYVSEINRLRLMNKQLKLDLQAEQDIALQLRKRINNAEKQKLETAAKTNAEIASLESQMTKVRSQVERGEAVRHNLEYELTKSQREVTQVKHASKEKEALLAHGTEDLKQKIGDLSTEVKNLQISLQSCKTNAQEQEASLNKALDESSSKLAKTRAELESVSSERDKMNELCRQHSTVISELNEKLQDFENDKHNVLESLRRATAELEYAKEREDRMKSDLESAMTRNKTLEENVEAERAAHLETKFNSEIVQLRVRDLDGAIDVEKSANVEATRAIERLTQQNRELEQVYEEERKSKKELHHKLEKTEKENASVRRQLSSEIEDKKLIIGNLSRELESHQKNFNELKSELSKAKKRQFQLEEMYGGAIKELEFLLQTFHFDDKKLRLARREEAITSSKGKKVSNPGLVVESFKQMLIQLKRKIDSQVEELSKSKKNCDRLSKEMESCKEMIKTKDKNLEETHKNYTKAAKDLTRVRANYTELESTMGKLKSNMQVTAVNQDKDRNRIQELSEEIMKLVKRNRAEEEEKIAFLHGLYQRLLTGHVMFPNKDKSFNQFSWSDLTDVVYEQVSTLIETLESAQEKLKASHEAFLDKEGALTKLKQDSNTQISRLTSTTRERESAWQQQKEELEQHYTQMLSDIQTRSKKSQAIADQAWEKVRATGSVQQGLESEVVELRRELAESQVHASSLLSCCALLCGAFYPLYTRVAMLSSERYILEDLYYSWETCRDRALYLSSVLRSGKGSDQDKPERDRRSHQKLSPILRFRIAIIAVLAANRLSFLGKNTMRCFVTYNSSFGESGLGVSVGNLRQQYNDFTGIARSFNEEQDDSCEKTDAQGSLLGWLSNQDLLETVVACMTDVYEVTRQKEMPNNPTEARAILAAARSSFSKFIDKLNYFFPSPSLPTQTSMRDRGSLQRRLERHLARILSSTPPDQRGTLVTLQELMSHLQNHILDLTQRLHAAEKERRHLLSELSELRQQIEDDGTSGQDEEKHSSGKYGTKYVPMSKFERVCVELSSALRREQKAQQLLQEQSSQLTELTSRLDLCTSEGMNKESNLVETQENLNEAEKELKHKEQSLRQVGKELTQLEFERDTLQSNLKDAENALRTAARDKEVLAQYIRSVEDALEKAKKQFIILREPQTSTNEQSLSRLLLDADLIPQDIGRAGPELIAVQNLVGCFVDAQHQAVNKIKTLEEEVSSHRDHIDTLKTELSNAVHRDFSEQLESMSDGALSALTKPPSEDTEQFVPLQEDPEDFSSDSPLSRVPVKVKMSPPVYHGKKSAFHSPRASKSPRHSSPRTPRGHTE